MWQLNATHNSEADRINRHYIGTISGTQMESEDELVAIYQC